MLVTFDLDHAPLSYSQYYVHIVENRNSQSCTECVTRMSPVCSPERVQESPRNEGVSVVSTCLVQSESETDIH